MHSFDMPVIKNKYIVINTNGIICEEEADLVRAILENNCNYVSLLKLLYPYIDFTSYSKEEILKIDIMRNGVV